MVSTSKYVDTIALIVRIAMCQRPSYPKPFKAQVVQECLQLGVSMASVALRPASTPTWFESGYLLIVIVSRQRCLLSSR